MELNYSYIQGRICKLRSYRNY